MKDPAKTLEIRFERTIAASPEEVFAGWLDPKTPGNPWNMAEKLLLNPQVDGLFYWCVSGAAHYGRFTEVRRAARIQHTWVSPNTLGEESMVTVTFTEQGEGTLMTLVHSGLPDNDKAKSHEKGWNYFLGNFTNQFAGESTKRLMA
ncbi:MAG: SRPBCC domain-containing protein [Steroidobacter sp.]